MFESLLRVRGEQYIEGNPLFDRSNTAHSLLIHGSDFSGKMTHALEAARRRSCRHNGELHCECDSCRDFSTYSMKNVVILSHRDYEMRIRSAITHFQRLKTRWLQIYLIKSVRVLLMSYHEALLGAQDTKTSALFAQAGEVDLLLDDLLALQPEEAVAKLGELEKSLSPLFAYKKTRITIDAMRSLHSWMHSTSVDDLPRFAIIEGMDESTVGANNSILKILEEPADHAFFIILAERPIRLLPTILSRLQKHFIIPVTEEERKKLLSTFFYIDDAHITSLRDFILQGAGYPLQEIHGSAVKFASSIVDAEHVGSTDMDAMFAPIDSMQLLSYYLEQVVVSLAEQQGRGVISLISYASMVKEIRESYGKAKVYNQQVRTFLDTLYYSLMAVRR